MAGTTSRRCGDPGSRRPTACCWSRPPTCSASSTCTAARSTRTARSGSPAWRCSPRTRRGSRVCGWIRVCVTAASRASCTGRASPGPGRRAPPASGMPRARATRDRTASARTTGSGCSGRGAATSPPATRPRMRTRRTPRPMRPARTPTCSPTWPTRPRARSRSIWRRWQPGRSWTARRPPEGGTRHPTASRNRGRWMPPASRDRIGGPLPRRERRPTGDRSRREIARRRLRRAGLVLDPGAAPRGLGARGGGGSTPIRRSRSETACTSSAAGPSRS